MALASSPVLSNFINAFVRLSGQGHKCFRLATIAHRRQASTDSNSAPNAHDYKDVVAANPMRQILEREFPNHFRDGKFIQKMSYVEFVDEALHRAKELGLEKELDLYKELLRVFPPGRFGPRYQGEWGLFHAPQQLAVTRIFWQMHKNGLIVDKEFEKLVADSFSIASDVWILVARYNYWSMKFRNLDQHPLPERLPKKPHELAKVAIKRMLPDLKSIITVTNTSQVPDSVDKTWLVSAQSPTQQAVIDRLDDKATLYIEDGGLAYVGSQYLSYFVLKYYVDEATREAKKEKPREFNFNTLKMSFFGKPIKEKLESLYDKHYADGSYILAIGASGTSSQDSLLSWLKVLQRRNPRLGKLNVVFKISRPSPEIIEYKPGEDSNRSQEPGRS